MPKVSKTVVDKELRDEVFFRIMENGCKDDFVKINDRQYGILLTDSNGERRYVRIGAIVAELREDMTAEELMQSEIDAYNAKQKEKEEKLKIRAEKAAKDKARREKEKEKENE